MLVTKEKFRRPELFKNVYLFFQILNQPKATFCFHKTNFVYSLSSQLKYSRTVINEKVPIHFSERYDKDQLRINKLQKKKNLKKEKEVGEQIVKIKNLSQIPP